MTGTIQALKARLHTLRQTARFLLQKIAVYGSETLLPSVDRHSLLQTRTEIAQCKAELQAQGVSVDDAPEDAAAVAGSASDLDTARALLKANATAVISTGIGGMGKTQLAGQIAHR